MPQHRRERRPQQPAHPPFVVADEEHACGVLHEQHEDQNRARHGDRQQPDRDRQPLRARFAAQVTAEREERRGREPRGERGRHERDQPEPQEAQEEAPGAASEAVSERALVAARQHLERPSGRGEGHDEPEPEGSERRAAEAGDEPRLDLAQVRQHAEAERLAERVRPRQRPHHRRQRQPSRQAGRERQRQVEEPERHHQPRIVSGHGGASQRRAPAHG